MDTKLFETFGKIAGLAGLGLAVVLVLFYTILKLNIFSKVPASKTYDLVRQLMYLAFAIGLAGVIAWAANNFKEKASSAITGRVGNSDTKNAVAGAEVTISGRPETARTDSSGNFTLSFVSNIPTGEVHLFIAKDGFKVYDRYIGVGLNLDAEIVPLTTVPAPAAIPSETPVTDSKTASAPPVAAPVMITTTETYSTDDVASGSCKDFGGWATVCSPDKPNDWTIVHQQFQLTGDRAGCTWAHCEALGPITATKACYRFQAQGHDEECKPFSNNTGIHYSKGVLTVVWQHPQ